MKSQALSDPNQEVDEINAHFVAGWILAFVLMCIACNPQSSPDILLLALGPLLELSSGTVEEWRFANVLLRSVRSELNVESRTVFRVRLPEGWEARHAQVGAHSWGGELAEDDFSLGYSGVPMAVSGLDEIVGNGRALFAQGLADQHIVVEEDDAVAQDTGPSTRHCGKHNGRHHRFAIFSSSLNCQERERGSAGSRDRHILQLHALK